MKLCAHIAFFHEIWQYKWMYKRIIDLRPTLLHKSVFLLGPRQTGKSTYIKTDFPEAHYIDLLQPQLFRKYNTNPELMAEEINFAFLKNKNKIIIIDEIQKIPLLLDEVHRQIELNKSLRFILTGSSARKLKKQGVNLLGGRARNFQLHPLVSKEIGTQEYSKNIIKYLSYGTIPSIVESPNPWADLNDYVGTYLKEEIQQEAIVRALEGFSRFLNISALTNAQQINFTEVAKDAEVPPRTVREYYQILVDTLVGHLLPAFEKTKKRKAMATAKFYFFDPGVTNALLGRSQLANNTAEFGSILEQAIFCELRAYIDYCARESKIYYWRSLSKFEVDFVIETKEANFLAIEVKTSHSPRNKDYRGISALEEDIPLKKKIVVCQAGQPRLTNDEVEILPIQIFLEKLWGGDLF